MEFNFKGIYGISNKDGDSLTIGTFNGVPTMTVFQKGSNRPVYNFKLTLVNTAMVKKTLKAVIDAKPDTKLSYSLQGWNADTKKYDKTTSILVFIKDENGIMYVDVSSPTMQKGSKFEFTIPGGHSIGPEQLTREQKSKISAEAFYEFLDKDATIIRLLSRFNFVPQAYNKNGNASSSNVSQSSNSGGSEINLFND